MILQEETKQKNKLFIGYTFLVLSVGLVIGLFLFNSYLEGKTQNLESQIGQYNTSIEKLKKNRSVQIYTLLEENKKLIENLEKKSKINDFIYNIREIQNTYTIIFKGFNYSNGLISMSVYAPFNTNMTAANRVSYFIKSYREDKNSIFDLDFINTFNGNDNMFFNVNLNLK